MIDTDPACDQGDVQDGVLFQRWKAGEPVALETLIRRHQPALSRMCGRLLGHPQAAEVDDAVQEVFLLLARLAPELREPQAVGAWMRRAAFGVCANRRRSETSRRTRERIAAENIYRQEPSTPESAETADAAVRVLAALPSDHRTVVEMYYLQGLDLGAIAHRLNITSVAARKRLQRGVSLLRGRFQRERSAVALLALLAWCEAAEAGAATAATAATAAAPLLTRKAAGAALALALAGAVLVAWQQPWRDGTTGETPLSTIVPQPTPNGQDEDANPSIPSGDTSMFARTALALAVSAAATVAAADGAPSASANDFCSAMAGSCPIAATFKTTGKDEIKVADMVAEMLARSKQDAKPNVAEITKTSEGFLAMLDADKNGALSRAEYNAFAKNLIKAK
jgi:RNA polymerase sigma-70 factor (ECF subfamily)